MHEIRIDTERNRLYVTLIGFFSIEEATRCAEETIEATRRLRSGYDVVTDVSQFKAGTPAVAEQAERVQRHFQASGARQGVRIVGKEVITQMQFNRTARRAGYISTAVETLAEAEIFLAKG